jgi:hypothetical protein
MKITNGSGYKSKKKNRKTQTVNTVESHDHHNKHQQLHKQKNRATHGIIFPLSHSQARETRSIICIYKTHQLEDHDFVGE